MGALVTKFLENTVALVAKRLLPPQEFLKKNQTPYLPPEVIEDILSKLTDLKAVLKSRLVCRSWNQACLSLLRRQSKFYKTVWSPKLKSILKFVSQEGQFILPFHLKHKVGVNWPELEFLALEFMQTMSQDVVPLMDFCGPNCFPKLTLYIERCCTPNAHDVLVDLNEFLSLMSPNLKILSVSFTPTVGVVSCRKFVEILRNNPVLFPNLKHLTCKTRDHDRDRPEFQDHHENNVESVLIENAHNLQQLTLSSDCFNYWPKTGPKALQTLKIFKVGRFGNSAQFLESLRASELTLGICPVLEHFEFDMTSASPNLNNSMPEILTIFSKTLKTIVVTLTPRYPSTSATLAVPFPSLPNLQHLTLKCSPSPDYASPKEFDFSKATLPQLSSVLIPYGCSLVQPIKSPGCEPLVQNLFPTVRHLTFQVDLATCLIHNYVSPTTNELEESSSRVYMDSVAQTFPNLATLTFLNDVSVVAAGQAVVERVLSELFRSETLFLTVETFEFEGYDKDYLRAVLGACSNGLAARMMNLRKVKLVCDSANDFWKDQELCFDLMASRLPNIKYLEISDGLFGENETERLKKLKLISSRFQGWAIKFI